MEMKVDPALCLLGFSPEGFDLSPSQSALLMKLLLQARRCILFQWIKDKPPTVTVQRTIQSFTNGKPLCYVKGE